jgi:hypothetical protein
MKRAWMMCLAACAALWTLGCGDDSDDGGSDNDSNNPNNSNNADNNGAALDPAPDQDPFPVGEGVDLRASFLRDTCALGCARARACGEGSDGCEAECVQAGQGGQARASCVLASECGEFDRCDASPPQDAGCEALCDGVEGCAGFPSPVWGPDAEVCREACMGWAQGRPSRKDAEIACYGDLIEAGCQLGDASRCRLDTGEQDTCAAVCQKLSRDCRAIPGEPFLTLSECLDDCRALPALQQLQVQICIDTADCDRFERCLPPAPAPDTCGVFCDALVGVCPDIGLNEASCGALCGGLAQALPGADMGEAAGCVGAFEACPGEAVYQCIFPQFEGCGEICEVLEGCGGDGPGCRSFCPALAGLEPEKMEPLYECVTTAGCAQLGSCFEGF